MRTEGALVLCPSRRLAREGNPEVRVDDLNGRAREMRMEAGK
jgi:hypothetical protein